MYEAGPVFFGCQQSSFREVKDVSDVILDLRGKKLPKSMILHLFGSKAAPVVTLADVHAVLFENAYLSKDLMATCLSRLCTLDPRTQFVHPVAWDKGENASKYMPPQGVKDVSGIVPKFPFDTKRVFFPFMVGRAWVLCAFVKDGPNALLAYPHSVRLPPHTIPFLKGVMLLLLGSRDIAAKSVFRCFAFESSDQDSGFLVHSICFHLQVCQAQDTSTWSQDAFKARKFMAAELIGENPERCTAFVSWSDLIIEFTFHASQLYPNRTIMMMKFASDRTLVSFSDLRQPGVIATSAHPTRRQRSKQSLI